MCSSIVFGVVLLALGASFLLGALFGISIPVFRILIGLLFFYLGFQLITGLPRHKHHWHCWSKMESTSGCHSTFMGSARVTLDEATLRAKAPYYEYATVFGSSLVDLSQVPVAVIKTLPTPLVFSINTVFGKTEVILNKEVPLRVEAQSAFGNVRFPDATNVAFGSQLYQANQHEQPLVIVRTNTVFGSTEMHYRV
jgi:predicted membrane protein